MPARMSPAWRAACVAASVACTGTSARAQWFTGVGDLPGSGVGSDCFDVSADGRYAIGSSSAYSGFSLQAFRWSRDGGMGGIGNLPGGPDHSEARGISPDGRVIVGGSHGSNGYEAFRWEEGRGMIGLGDLPGGGFLSYAHDASADGRVVIGESTSERSTQSRREAFRWTAESGMMGLGFLPGSSRPTSRANGISADGSVIVGASNSARAPSAEAFIWTEHGGMQPLGFLDERLPSSEALGISDNGRFVVGKGTAFHEGVAVSEAFLWSAETGMIALGDLAGSDFLSAAVGVSGDGRVVVGFGTGTDGHEAMMWVDGLGMRSVADVLLDHGIDVRAMGWHLDSAQAVSADGRTIVGWGHNPQNAIEGWVAYIPTPSSALPLALGAMLTARRRR